MANSYTLPWFVCGDNPARIGVADTKGEANLASESLYTLERGKQSLASFTEVSWHVVRTTLHVRWGENYLPRRNQGASPDVSKKRVIVVPTMQCR